MYQVTIHGEGQLAAISARLRRSRADLRAQLTAALRAAARPAVLDLKREIETADVGVVSVRAKKRGTFRKTIPARGRLRHSIARVVEADISTGADPRARIWLREGAIPASKRRTVKYIVGSSPRWSHPVMGNRRAWVTRQTPNLWMKVVPKHLGRFRREVDEAVEAVARRIER